MVKKYKSHCTEDFPHVTPQTFRHSFCTHLVNAGMNPKALQYLMGHSNITMRL
nr:tyrosine-type recombinase/integrase [Beduini massiliensis]